MITYFSMLAMALIVAPGQSITDGMEAALNRPFTGEYENVHLTTILNEISNQCDVNIIVDNRVVAPIGTTESIDQYVTDGIVGHVGFGDAPVRVCLQGITFMLNLDYSVQSSFVWISTSDYILHETFEDLETRYYDIRDPIVTDVNAAYRDIPAPDMDIVRLLDRIVPRIIEPGSKQQLSFIRFNEANRKLIAHTSPRNHAKIEAILALIDHSHH